MITINPCNFFYDVFGNIYITSSPRRYLYKVVFAFYIILCFKTKFIKNFKNPFICYFYSNYFFNKIMINFKFFYYVWFWIYVIDFTNYFCFTDSFIKL